MDVNVSDARPAQNDHRIVDHAFAIAQLTVHASPDCRGFRKPFVQERIDRFA
jgi:hypothetical protein